MAIQIKTIKGHDYAYETHSYRDKETKKVRKTTKYLGVITDPETKAYERRYVKSETQKTEKSEKLSLSFGDAHLISETVKNSSLNSIFRDIMPSDYETLMSLICFKLCENSAFVNAKTWLEGNYASIIYSKTQIDSQRITDFLKKLGSESIARKFWGRYLPTVADKNTPVAIDSTGLPNEIDIPVTEWGHHGGDTEREIRLILVIDQKSGKPLYYRYVPGNIVDVSTLATTMKEFSEYGVGATFALLDAGYYSEENIEQLYSEKISFLTRLPSGRKLYKNLISETNDTLEKAKNRVVYNERGLFVEKKEIDLFGNKGFAYIICDVKRKSSEMNKFLISSAEDELSDEEFDEQAKFKGKLVLISDKDVSIKEIVPLYYSRQSAENLFGVLKSEVNILPLRSHSVATVKGVLMLNFLSLIVFNQLRKLLDGKITVESALLEGRNLHCKIYGNEIIVSEPKKRFKDICSYCEIVVPNLLGI